MKRTLLLPIALIGITGAMAQTVILSEHFDDHAAGSFMAVNDPVNWSTWSAMPGGTEDGPVSAAYSHSGTKSVAVVSTSVVNGGPVDLLLKLGDKTTGIYALSFWMYIPTGKGGYFNVQHQEDAAPAQYAIDVTFLGNGSITVDDGTADTIGTYPNDSWFNVLLTVNLNDTLSTLTVAGNPPYTWASNTSNNVATLVNQLGSIDFYAFAGGAVLGEYYIDDVEYTDNSNISIQESAVGQVRAYPNPATDVLTIEVAAGAASAAVQLFDAAGLQVQVPVMRSGELLRADVAGLASGVYTVRINSNGELSVGSFAKL
jgi:hypothetical protein